MAALLVSCAFTIYGKEEGEPLTDDHPEIRVMKFAESISYGDQHAQEWRGDSFLAVADFSFAPAPTDATITTSLTYLSENDSSVWLLVALQESQLGELEVVHRKEGTFEDSREFAAPIHPEEINLTPREAVNKAMSDSQIYPAVKIETVQWPASVELRREDTFNFSGRLVWSVSFLGKPGLGSIHIILNDATGEIHEIRDFR